MKKVISVITTSNIGIWNIPMRGQNFINNHYASINNIKISSLISEGLFYTNFNTVKSAAIKMEAKNTSIIFTSTLQLSLIENKNISVFVNFFKKFDIHFALELKQGKGKLFLNNIFKESKYFLDKEIINIKNINNYQKLFKKYKNKII